MKLKEKIKKEIDKMPDELLYEVHQLLKEITAKTKKRKKKIRSIHLKGQYDNVNIRQKAYE